MPPPSAKSGREKSPYAKDDYHRHSTLKEKLSAELMDLALYPEPTCKKIEARNYTVQQSTICVRKTRIYIYTGLGQH